MAHARDLRLECEEAEEKLRELRRAASEMTTDQGARYSQMAAELTYWRAKVDRGYGVSAGLGGSRAISKG